jgi:Tol biopolymer transport system component
MRRLQVSVLAAIAAALSVFPAAVNAAPGDITLISVRWPGQTTSMYGSYGARISSDGRFLAFFSTSPDLVPRTLDATVQLYVRNLQTGTIERISADSVGHAANADSDGADISADGRFVAFTTSATNVVPGDTNGVGDVFIRDRQTHATERVSVNSSGAQANRVSYSPSISADGRFVAFASKAANLVSGDTNNGDDVFVRDRQTGRTERVSVKTGGAQANNASFGPAISADGRYVAFISRATNLVAGDTNGMDDVFIHDRVTGSTERVSLGVGGAQADGSSARPAISADGRYVAFKSDATNLVAGDTNGATDLFVRDLLTGVTERDSVTSGGAQTDGVPWIRDPSDRAVISADGRFVSFVSGSANLPSGGIALEVYVHDRLTGQTMLGSTGAAGIPIDGYSGGGSLSADGRYLGFDSYAANLVKGDRNGTVDVFVRDRQASSTVVASTNEVVSKAAGSVDSDCDGNAAIGGPSISGDGRYVVFPSTAPDLVPGQIPFQLHAFIRDRQTGKTKLLAPDESPESVVISADGSTMAGFGWCSGGAFLADVQTGKSQPLPSDLLAVGLSQDGRYAVFASSATNLVSGDTNAADDIFVFDRITGTYERASTDSSGQQANSYSWGASISGNGRYVAFTSDASNLVSGDTNGAWDTFVHDRQTGKSERVSVNSAGQQAVGGYSAGQFYGTGISADGRYVAFSSTATNLVSGGTNGALDVFVRDRQTGKTECASVNSHGIVGDSDSGLVAISPDGRFVLFWSAASNLVPNNVSSRFYLHDRQTGATTALFGQNGSYSSNFSAPPSLSSDLRFVAFSSYEALLKTDLNTALGGNGAVDIYVQERAPPP